MRRSRRSWGPSRPLRSHVENNLAGRATLVERLERLRRALERKALADDRAYEAGVDHAVDGRPDLAVEVRLAHHVGAPAGPHDLGVLEQQPVDAHLGNRAAGE